MQAQKWLRDLNNFFPGDPAERVYLIRRGAVRLSRVYESGEEITAALLRENSLFGVLSLLTVIDLMFLSFYSFHS